MLAEAMRAGHSTMTPRGNCALLSRTSDGLSYGTRGHPLVTPVPDRNVDPNLSEHVAGGLWRVGTMVGRC
jgi:hypothetical protein